MKKSIFIVVFFCFLSCKKNTGNNVEINPQDTGLKGNVFKITLYLKNLKNENIELFYQKDNDENFTRSKVVKGEIDTTQKSNVKFKLPKNIFPKSLRFDFDEKETNHNFIFNSMLITYEDLVLKISLHEFNAFFSPNEYINYNKENGNIQFKVIKGKSDPFFVSRPLFNKRLEIEKR